MQQTKRLKRWWPKLFNRGADPGTDVIVWTMGKVGSTTIHHSLESAGLNSAHVHYLTDRRISWQYQQYGKTAGTGSHVHTSRRIKCEIKKELAAAKSLQSPRRIITIVTAVRDPVARNFSAFFENLERHGLDTLETDELIERFISSYPHDLPLTWFDSEIKAITNIDVFESPFDPMQGWAMYESGIFRLVVLRIDLPRAKMAGVLGRIFGRPVTQLKQKNAGATKSYASKYDAFRQKMILPDEYLDRLYDSKFSKHFWSAQELADLRSSWQTIPTSGQTVELP